MPEPVPMVLDTDGGVDDAAALWWAATDPRVDLVAVTSVWGNVGAEQAARNLCTVLHAAGRDDVPVAVGLDGPIGPAPELRPADFIHGSDGLGDAGHGPAPWGPVDEPAVDLLLRLAGERRGELDLVAGGPLTNLAAAVRRDPSWASQWRALTVMGGSVSRAGNAAPAAEANIAHDPVAAAEVVAAGWSEPPLLVGLDVTLQATLGPGEMELLEDRRNAAAQFLAGPLGFYREFGSTFTGPGECPCHDLVAVMAAVVPALLDAPVLPLAVQATPGPAWGATIADLRELAFERLGEASRQATPEGFAPWRVALEAAVERFRAEVWAMLGARPLDG